MPNELIDILGEPENKQDITSILGEPDLKKKDQSEIGSNVSASQEAGGTSVLPTQNPFEKAALEQPPVDEQSVQEPEKVIPTTHILDGAGPLKRLAYKATTGILPLLVVSMKRAAQNAGSGNPILYTELLKNELKVNATEQANVTAELNAMDLSEFEKIGGEALKLIVDAPVFGAGSKAGTALVNPLLKAAGFIEKDLVKSGIQEITAKKITNNIIKQKAGEVLASYGGTAGALVPYSGLEVLHQGLGEGKDWKDLDYLESLKAMGSSATIAAPLALVNPAFSFGGKIIDKHIDSQIGKQLSKVVRNTGELAAESAIFAIGSPKDPNKTGIETFLENLALFGILKTQRFLGDLGKKDNLYKVELDNNEKISLQGLEKKVTSIEDLESSPKLVEDILKNENVPLTVKAKVAWRFGGVKLDQVDFDPNEVRVVDTEMRTYNKSGDIIESRFYSDFDQAKTDAIKANTQIEDLRLFKTAQKLDLDQQTQVTNEVEGTKDLLSAAATQIDSRTPEQKELVKKFNSAVERVKSEEVTNEENAAKKVEKERVKRVRAKVKEEKAKNPDKEVKEEEPKETFIYKGKPSFMGIVDTRNGNIIQTETYLAQKEGHAAYLNLPETEAAGYFQGGKYKRFIIDSQGNVTIMEGINHHNLRELNLPRDIKDQIEIIGQPKKKSLPIEEPKTPEIKSVEEPKGNVEKPKKKPSQQSIINLEKELENNQNKLSRTHTKEDGKKLIARNNDIRKEVKLLKEEQQNAAKEQITATVDVRQQTENGEGMGGRNPEYQEPTRENEGITPNASGNVEGAQGKEAQRKVRTKEIENDFQEEAKNIPPETGSLIGNPLDFFKSPNAKSKPSKDIKQWFREQFRVDRNMPKGVYKIWLETKGKIIAKNKNIEYDLKDITSKINETYLKEHPGKKITETEQEEIQKALESLGTSQESKAVAINIISKYLPQDAIDIVENMRKSIDVASEEAMKPGLVGMGMKETMDKNRGYYVTRTYKKHTDKDWVWEKIPMKIKVEAADKLIEIYPEKSNDEIKGILKSMLESKDLTDFVIKRGEALTSVDKSSLKRRSVFLTDNPEIRKLLGENRDPFYNYAVSLARLTEIAERGKMMDNMINLGLKDAWVSTKPSYDSNHITQVFKDVKGSEYYTTPEIAHAINTFFESSSITNKYMRGYMKLITATKLSKTAGSIKGIVRNFKSNITNAIANGNWNGAAAGKYLFDNMKTKELRRKFFTQLREDTIIGDSASVGELMNNVQDLSRTITEIPKHDDPLSTKFKRNVIDNMIKVYGGADDVWKVYRYASEYVRYKKANLKRGLPEVEAEKATRGEVRDILHKTSTYYSQLPKFIQDIRRLPFVNTFISFPYLSTSNYIGGWQVAIREMKDPYLRHIGIQRIGGSLTSVALLATIAAIRNRKQGVSETETEAYRRFLPKFWKNDIITVDKVNGDGTIEYTNTSYMDYYGALTSPMLMLQRKASANGEITTDDVADAAIELAGKYIGWDILFNRVTQIKANKDDNGKQIYNPQDDLKIQFGQISEYIWSALEPGTLTDLRRAYTTKKEGGAWERQLGGIVAGSQARTIDPLKSLSFYMMPEYKDEIENSRRIYTQALRKYNRIKNPDQTDLFLVTDAKERAEGAINKIVSEVGKDYDAAITVGVDKKALHDIITGRKLGLDKQLREAIIYKKELMLDKDGGIINKRNEEN